MPKSTDKTPTKLSPTKKVTLTKGDFQKPAGVAITIHALGFHNELGLDGYIVEKNSTTDGFLNNYKLFVKGSIDYYPLNDAGFIGYQTRRHSPQNNEAVFNQGSDFERLILVSKPIDGNSAISRKKGMAALTDFFKESAFSKYPPTRVTCVDDTPNKDCFSLDQCTYQKVLIHKPARVPATNSTKLTTQISWMLTLNSSYSNSSMATSLTAPSMRLFLIWRPRSGLLLRLITLLQRIWDTQPLYRSLILVACSLLRVISPIPPICDQPPVNLLLVFE